jgi:hypothetical protein
LTEIEREIEHVSLNYASDITAHMSYAQKDNIYSGMLEGHELTPVLRARMIDWMIEVLTNFKCDDLTFFLSVSLMDRYFIYLRDQGIKAPVSELHITGVASMFLASKYEDIYPLKMKTVFEKIGHKRIPVNDIKAQELKILKGCGYMIQTPTSLDFLKSLLKQVLGIHSISKYAFEPIPASELSGKPEDVNKLLLEKLSVYFAKMTTYDF